jgi:DNA modification methylase
MKTFENGVAYFGDALETVKQLQTESIDSVITSPPYYQLRDYGFEGQWGSEVDFRDYLDKMISLMIELKRVLKPTGTMWVNLGDTYSTVSR